MGNSINLSILIPLIPMGMVLFILTLLVSFNRTINRLTKPVSFLVILSLLSSALISSFFYFKKIEGDVLLYNYNNILQNKNLVLHLNSLTEQITILSNLLTALVIAFLFYKLPRKKGYVSLLIGIGLISSSIIIVVMFLNFSVLI